MKKELKVSELAAIWGVSVPTTWNRIRKEGLETFKKKNENGKEINYIIISDDIIDKYVINLNNNVNEVYNNGYYEDLLSENKVNNPPKNNNNSISASELFDRLTTLNNEYNDRIERLNNELLTSEKQRLLLEDKASREGLYLKEINELKTDNEKLINRNKWMLITLITLITLIITVIITLTIVNNHSKTQDIKKEHAPQEVLQNPVQHAQSKR